MAARARDERYERRAKMNKERVLIEERDRRAQNRNSKKDRINEFMRMEEAVAREREDAARIEKDEREFNEKKLQSAKDKLVTSIANAIAQRDEEKTLSDQMHRAAVREVERTTPETATFPLAKENCTSDFRDVVVLPVPGKRWFAPRIGFFKSTASSNGSSFSHLRNTYLPTLGVLDASGEGVPGLEPLDGEGDIIIKTGLFKGIFECKPPPGTGGQPPIPAWINELLTDYCSYQYPELITRDFYRPIVDKEDYDKSDGLFDSLQEMYQLFDLCRHYFSDVWQIAMSIALSEHFGTGVWVEDGNDARKLFHFRDFIKSKFNYTVEGYKGAFDQRPLRGFLTDQNAQSDFSFVREGPLPKVDISLPKHFLFTGRSVHSLSVPLRVYLQQHPQPKGGTRRKRRSVKTRRQKRR